MSDHDFWRQWEQRTITEQAQARIAEYDLSLRAWQAETRNEIAQLVQRGYYEMARQRQATYDATTAHYLREMATMQAAADQQCAEIDQRYDAEAREREQSADALRQQWADAPNNTPRESMPDWREMATPAPAYGPRPISDMPAPASPWAEPDMSILTFGDDEEQSGGLLVSLIDWLR